MSGRDLPRDDLVSGADGVEMRCRACGARFPRRDAATPEKGSLACPSCVDGAIEHIAG